MATPKRIPDGLLTDHQFYRNNDTLSTNPIYAGSPAVRNILVEIRAISTFDGGPEGFTLASMHPLEETIFLSQPIAVANLNDENPTHAVDQNFPNPFNPDTWIPYTIVEATNVRVQIFDMQGRLIRTLNLGHRPPGTYVTKEKAAYWDGRNEHGESVSSGTYLYFLEAGRFKASRKMILTK